MTDPDADRTPLERIRRCAHRDIDRVCDTWPHALTDAQARGYPTGRTFDGTPHGTGELTSVEAAASRPDFATAWIAELGDILDDFDIPIPGLHPPIWDTTFFTRTARLHLHVRANHPERYGPRIYNRITHRLHRLAEAAIHYWPDPPKTGQTIQGVTVGERNNQVETCCLCGEPAPSGRDVNGNPLLRRDKDGNVYHAAGKGCFWQIWRQRRRSA